MNITGSRDGKIFFIDNDKVMIDGKMYYEKAPADLPKADGYALLAEVRVELKRLAGYTDDRYVSESLEFCIKDLEKISEHFT